jgi:hypothetical protein
MTKESMTNTLSVLLALPVNLFQAQWFPNTGYIGC